MKYKKGNKPWNKGLTAKMDKRVKSYAEERVGKKSSQKTKDEISSTRKRLFSEGKITIHNKINFTEEQKQEIKRLYEEELLNPIEIGIKFNSNEHVIIRILKELNVNTTQSHRRKILFAKGRLISPFKELRKTQIFPLKDTTIEVKIQDFLKQLEIPFLTHQHIKDIKYAYQCDILIPSNKTIIECDGDYWHGNLNIHPINKLSKRIQIQRILDFERTSQLEEAGYKVIRLWGNEIKNMDLNKFNKIANLNMAKSRTSGGTNEEKTL